MSEKLAQNPDKFRGHVYNAGTNSPKSVHEVLKTVYNLTGKQSDFHKIEELMKTKKTVGEIDCQYMDFEKVNEHFNWAPSHSFESGVRKTIKWYNAYLSKKYAS